MANCRACAHCYMEPDDLNFICGHPDAGSFGTYTHRATAQDGHCGPDHSKFAQHPLRTAEGDLKPVGTSEPKLVIIDLGDGRWGLRREQEFVATGSLLAMEAACRLFQGGHNSVG